MSCPCAAPVLPPAPAPQVLKLPRSGGVVVRSRELRAQARKVRVEDSFYGIRKVGAAACSLLHLSRETWGVV